VTLTPENKNYNLKKVATKPFLIMVILVEISFKINRNVNNLNKISSKTLKV
jgi:hypothetical protein